MTTIIFHNDKKEDVKVRYHPANAPPRTVVVKPRELNTFVMKTDLILIKTWESGVILLQDRKTVSPKESQEKTT